MDTQNWLHNFICFYRELGFLKSFDTMSVEDLCTYLQEFEDVIEDTKGLESIIDDVDDFDDLFSSSDNKAVLDLRILSILDLESVWWRWPDYEETRQIEDLDEKPPSDGFCELLKKLAQISQGAFQPTKICETKNTLKFSLQTPHSIQINYIREERWQDEFTYVPDLAIVNEINKLLGKSEKTFRSFTYVQKPFEEYVPFNATAHILFLSDKEVAQIKATRKWTF